MIALSERTRRLAEAVVSHAAFFHARGWVAGTAGNLSVRTPEGPVLITPSGRHKGTLSVEDLVAVSPDGRPIGCAGDRPSAETSLHAAVYRSVPGAGAVYHVHTVESNLVSLWDREGDLRLPPLEMLKGLGISGEDPKAHVAVFPNLADVPKIAAEVVERFERGGFEVPAFLIRLHGLTVWGEDPDQALHHIELMDFLLRYLVLERQTLGRNSGVPDSPGVPTRGRKGGKWGGGE
jgi:methylthioribulose-1-phosphate dehydratase